MMKIATSIIPALLAVASTFNHCVSAQQAMSMAMSMPSTTTTQDKQTLPENACSCSPRAYTFQLNFAGGCMEETYDDNVGIDGSLCFFTKGGTPEDVADGDVGIPLMSTSGSSVRVSTIYNQVVPEDGPVRGLRRSISINSVVDGEGEHVFGRVASMKTHGNGPHGTMKTKSTTGRGSSNNKKSIDGSIVLALLEKAKSSFPSHHKHATNMMARQVKASTPQVEQGERHVQELDTQVTTVTSVTFLEFDSEMNHILNQNSTYFETSLSNGASISYPSISSTLDLDLPLEDQAELVPGGVMLVLFGLNRENIMVQNTAVWGYKLENCQGPAVSDGDSIGWTVLSDYTPPRAAFCEGVTDAPTNTPSVSPTTDVPSSSPTTLAPVVDFVKASVTNSPTPKPVPAMSVSMVEVEPPSPPTYNYAKGKSSKTKSSKKCSGKSSKKNGSGCDTPKVDNTPYVMFTKASKIFGKSQSAGQIQVPRPDAKATKLFKHPKSAKSKSSKTLARPPVVSSTKSSKSPSIYYSYTTTEGGSMSMSASEVITTASPVASPKVTPFPTATQEITEKSVTTVSPTAMTNLTTAPPVLERPPLTDATTPPMTNLTTAPPVLERPPLTDATRPPLPDSETRNATSVSEEPSPFMQALAALVGNGDELV